MSNTVATIIILSACLLAAALAVAYAGYSGNKYGFNTPRGVAAVAGSVLYLVLLVLAVWVRFDTIDEAGAKVGVELTPGSAGVASNGNCDPACLMAILSRQGGAAN